MRLNQQQFDQVYSEALKNNQAFVLDWKYPIEDIVFNVKTVCPNLNVKALPEKQVHGDWIQTIVIDDKEHSFKTESETFVLDVISTINTYLKNISQTLVFFDTEDDDYFFFLINLAELPEYLDKGFTEV